MVGLFRVAGLFGVAGLVRVAGLVGQFGDTQADMLGVILNRPRQTAGGYFKKNYRLMAKYTEIED